MKYRSECDCRCHTNKNIRHIARCCVPDPEPEATGAALDVPLAA